MSSSEGWKLRLRHAAVVQLDCGCRRRKRSSSPSSPTKVKPPSSSAANTTAAATATSSKRTAKGAAGGAIGKGGGSVAVVVESADPYHDFRRSMLQMIVENEIYEWEGLEELLRRFLFLNSASQHGVIFRAFAGICGGASSSSPSSSTAAPPPPAAACSPGSCGGEYGLELP